MVDTPTTEQINAHFSAMDDSVNLINSTVADDTDALSTQTVKEVKDMITRNTAHLELQLSKDWAKDDSRDKISYTDAITTGKNYVANNEE